MVDEQRAGQLERLPDGDVLEEAGGLHHRGDEAVRDGAARGLAEHGDRAGGRFGEAEDHVDGRGLTGAVRPEEGDDLAGPDFQVDAPDRVDGAEVLPQTGRRDGEVLTVFPEHARPGR